MRGNVHATFSLGTGSQLVNLDDISAHPTADGQTNNVYAKPVNQSSFYMCPYKTKIPPSFNLADGKHVDSCVLAIVNDSSGNVYIGGSFTNVQEIPAFLPWY